MKPLLLVLNPRRIPECIEAIEALEIDKAWLTGYTEKQLEQAVPEVLEATDHDPILVLSDDTIPEQDALDAVLKEATQYPVSTGFCNLDVTSQYVNLTRSPFKSRHSEAGDYDFITYAEMGDVEPGKVARSWFTGMCLTCMPRELWNRYGFETYQGRSSDFALSLKLQDDGVPIVAPPAGMVWHVKERWNYLDQARDKWLLVGEIPAETRLDLQATVPVHPNLFKGHCFRHGYVEGDECPVCVQLQKQTA